MHDTMMGGSSAARATLIALGLVVLVMATYGRVGGHDFVDFDDSEYVYENPWVRAGLTREGLSWAFTTTHAGNWHPLTWLSHMADVEVFGVEPGWHHRVNVLIHALNGVLVFLVLTGMTGATWRSAFAAALFAVHPLHVESVAWVAERKDVLSTFFWLLSMGAYVAYVRRPGAWRYLGVTVCFALGLLSKPMAVTLPFVLLLLDYWPLGRLTPRDPSAPASVASRREQANRLGLEKLPLLVLAVGSSIATYAAQASKAATASLEGFPLGDRVSNALVSYVLYLVKTVWPASLAAFYPHPASYGEHTPIWQALAAGTGLAVVTTLALAYGAARPYMAVGWLWYVGTLVPVIGLVQVGSQAMADRYTYVPLIGIFLVVAWGVPDLLGRGEYRRPVLVALGTAAIMGLSMATWVQVAHWRNNASLYNRAIGVTRNNWLAWNNLGNDHLKRGEFRHAMVAFQEALRIKPGYADAWYNAGVALGGLKDYQRAIASYQEALRLDPTNADGWVNRGLAHQHLGQYAQAVACYEFAVRLRPTDGIALRNLVVTHALRGDRGKALEAYRRLRAVDPAVAEQLLRSIDSAR